MKSILLAFFSLALSIPIYAQTEYKLLKTACKKESDSLINLFINNWQNEIKQVNNQNANDSIEPFLSFMKDFYEIKINQLEQEKYLFPYDKLDNKYLIFDFTNVILQLVNSDSIENLLINSKVCDFEHDKGIITVPRVFKKELGDFIPDLTYQNCLFLNSKYEKTLDKFYSKRHYFWNSEQKQFLSNRIFYYWLSPPYGTIDNITMFKSRKVAVVSYRTGSECCIEDIYKLKDGKWEFVRNLYLECISAIKVKK